MLQRGSPLAVVDVQPRNLLARCKNPRPRFQSGYSGMEQNDPATWNQWSCNMQIHADTQYETLNCVCVCTKYILPHGENAILFSDHIWFAEASAGLGSEIVEPGPVISCCGTGPKGLQTNPQKWSSRSFGL